MILNWTLEVVVDFIASTAILIAAILSHVEPKTKKIKSLLFIKLAFFLMALYLFFDGITILFLNEELSRFNVFIIFLTSTSLVIGINYILKESFKSLSLIIICTLGGVLCYLAFQPGVVETVIQSGAPNVNWVGAFEVTGMLVQLVGIIVTVYWGIRTWIGAPFLIKKEAFVFFLGILINALGSFIFYLLYYFNPIFIIYSNLMLVIGTMIYIITISKEPKLLYILPFTIYRIAVKDRDGSPIYDHDWSELQIDEKIFTGFLNAVQIMSKEVINMGGIMDINLEDGILILNESNNVTVGLASSKSSKLLRECVMQFTQDFEKKFERELKKSIKDPSVYEGAYELIERYFANFPYKTIKSIKQPLILTRTSASIPKEIENKLKDIFKDTNQFEKIKMDLLKSPLSVSSEFFKLFDRIQEEKQKISKEESQFIEDNTETDKNT